MNKLQRVMLGVMVLLAAGLTACNGRVMVLSGSGSQHVEGDGEMVMETRDVAPFHGVRLLSSGNATIVVGEPQSLRIEAEANIMPYLTSYVDDGILVLGVDENTSIESDQGWFYTIAVESLDQLDILGSVDVEASGFAGGALSVTITGSGTITTSGGVEAQAVEISGSGDYRGFDLASQTASVSISGSGDAEVDVSDSLRARISGSGNIIYTGNPALDEDISGSGDVEQR